MPGAEGGGIFVSYRRQESAHLAGRLYDRLADRFGEGQVFIDVDAIELGVDFAEEISRAVAACQVLLAVIGPTWLTTTDERGRRRLDDPDDIVRLEIEAALARNVRVIPILVEGAVMPGGDDLPETLAGLARRNALLIRHESFRYDAGRLVAAIERVLAAVPGAAAVPGTAAASGVPEPRSAEKAISSKVAQQGPGHGTLDDAPARPLVIQAGDQRYTFDTDFTAGRQAPLLVSHQSADEYHARFCFADGVWHVEDLGSTNGTWLNGRRIHRRQQVKKGDKIGIGRAIVIVESA